MLVHIILSILLVAACFLQPHESMAQTTTGQWRFAVLLNGNPIGEHLYILTPQGKLLQVQSRAEMRVNFLFFEAFRYQHTATELWQDNCLMSIESQTQNNNKMLKVSGSRAEESFRVQATENDATLQGCVRSFAYWDRSSIVNATELLNSQSGELMLVDVEAGNWETVEAAGLTWQAQKISLIGHNLHIDLWYGPNGEWLKLRSTLPNDRELDYQLLERPASPLP